MWPASLANRLDARNMLCLRNFNIGNNYSCVVCSGEEQTIGNLHFRCPFSVAVWSSSNIQRTSNASRIEMVVCSWKLLRLWHGTFEKSNLYLSG